MQEFGKKHLILELKQAIEHLPESLGKFHLELSADGRLLTYSYDSKANRTGINALLQSLDKAGISMRDLKTTQSSLEDIFVNIVRSVV